MQYREFGTTGKQISILGFGGMRFDMEKSLEENADLVRYAVDNGINYLDTAPNYCNEQSEVIIGMAAKDFRDKVVISTKGMPTAFDTAEKAIEAVKASLDKLKVDKIDFYHVWCLRKMEHYELAMKPGGQYEGLLRCKEEGLIDHILFSTHQKGDEIKTMVEKGGFDGVLFGMNILNFPYRWDGAVAAHASGMGTIAMNPLSGGAIPQHEKELAFLATREGESPTDAALRFNLGCPYINITLNGFTTREHIDQACRIAETAAPFSDEELDALREKLGKNMDAVCTGCGYCKGCPVGIPVASYMQFYNDKQMFEKTDEQMTQALGFQHDWGLLVGREAEAAACVQCGQCERLCTQHLPIIDRLTEIAAWEREKAANAKS